MADEWISLPLGVPWVLTFRLSDNALLNISREVASEGEVRDEVWTGPEGGPFNLISDSGWL